MRKKRSKIRKRLEKVTDAIRHKYYDIVPHDWRPHQIWYRLKCRLFKRYTTIKCRYMPHTWMDRTAVLPHTMFEILSRFIEEECSPGHVEWYGEWGHKITVDGQEKYVRDEMQHLYDWWHQVYNKEYEEVNDILWKEIYKHPSTRDTIPVDADDNEVEEDDAEWFRWEPEFPTEEDKEIHDCCLHAVNKLERMQDAKLQEMMHRLVNLTPYLWT